MKQHWNSTSNRLASPGNGRAKGDFVPGKSDRQWLSTPKQVRPSGSTMLRSGMSQALSRRHVNYSLKNLVRKDCLTTPTTETDPASRILSLKKFVKLMIARQ